MFKKQTKQNPSDLYVYNQSIQQELRQIFQRPNLMPFQRSIDVQIPTRLQKPEKRNGAFYHTFA